MSGDQIEVNGNRGTVEGLTIRETRIVTFDGRLVVVETWPGSMVSSPIPRRGRTSPRTEPPR